MQGAQFLCGNFMNRFEWRQGFDGTLTLLIDVYTAMSDRDGNLAISAHHIANGISNLVVPMGRSEGNSELHRCMETLWHDHWQFEHITFTCFHHNSSDLASFFQYISHQTCDKRYSHNSVELFLSFIHPILLSIVFFQQTCLYNQSNFVYYCSEISYLKITFKIFLITIEVLGLAKCVELSMKLNQVIASGL